MSVTSFDDFRTRAERQTCVPVVKEVPVDLLTPVSAFLKIAEFSDYAFLFEHVDDREHRGRYAFLGKDPSLVLRQEEGHTVIERHGETTRFNEPLLTVLRRVMGTHRAGPVPGLPWFAGGAVGYLGYEAVQTLRGDLGAEVGASDRLDASSAGVASEGTFLVFDTVLVFDHLRHRVLIVANAFIHAGEPLESQYAFACARIAFIERELDRELSRSPATREGRDEGLDDRGAAARTLLGRAREAAQGRCTLVTLCETVSTSHADVFSVYRALRHTAPSRYLFFLRCGPRMVCGCSPETLVRVADRRVDATRVTRTPRCGNPVEFDDGVRASAVACSDRERIAHLGLVDAVARDLARVCLPNTVRVTRFMEAEDHSTGSDVSSTVEGVLSETHDRLDALAACSPSGSVVGTPRHHAQRVAAAAEQATRGLFGGAVGYLDFAGNLDFCAPSHLIAANGRDAAVLQAGITLVPEADAGDEPAQRDIEVLLQALVLSQAIR